MNPSPITSQLHKAIHNNDSSDSKVYTKREKALTNRLLVIKWAKASIVEWKRLSKYTLV
jgi:hypothetical protein